MDKGWQCPVCGRGVSPGERYCGHSEWPVPMYPASPQYGTPHRTPVTRIVGPTYGDTPARTWPLTEDRGEAPPWSSWMARGFGVV